MREWRTIGAAESVTSTHSPEAEEMSHSDTSSRPLETSRHERPELPVWRNVMFSMRAKDAVECTVWLRDEVMVTPPLAPTAPAPLWQPSSITGTSMRNDSRYTPGRMISRSPGCAARSAAEMVV